MHMLQIDIGHVFSKLASVQPSITKYVTLISFLNSKMVPFAKIRFLWHGRGSVIILHFWLYSLYEQKKNNVIHRDFKYVEINEYRGSKMTNAAETFNRQARASKQVWWQRLEKHKIAGHSSPFLRSGFSIIQPENNNFTSTFRCFTTFFFVLSQDRFRGKFMEVSLKSPEFPSFSLILL